ncbi:hypothetical protein Nepgr_003198 [Nepenthes gracilis]|uniref:MADS-box domain-containing protein n=1 Tax=Nepenthes gracilis TaxID=150966 RepID=A0AAD3RZ14_NEPGR|nr:hypothetical protein Nepgr_003198 [Nepenthes gracilis]
MGRVKLNIKRLEKSSSRQITYSKRRNGMLKKARELAVLCDIDLILLMFSPAGKPTLCLGDRSNLEQIIVKFAQLPAHERAKRKLEVLEALKKTFKKLEHEVKIEDFFGTSSQTVEELSDQVRLLQTQLAEVYKRLSYWNNPEKIDSVEHLSQMEDSVRDSLSRIHLYKESIEKHQMMSLECGSQLQNRMHLPFATRSTQDTQSLSRLLNNETEVILPDETSFLQQRDWMCNTDFPLPGYCGFYGTGKEIEMDAAGQVANTRQDCNSLNELAAASGLGLQIGEQYPYFPYGSPNWPDMKEVFPETELNFQVPPMDYLVSSNFELPRSWNDNWNQVWLPASGPCTVPTFSENSYPQAQVSVCLIDEIAFCFLLSHSTYCEMK